MEKILLYVEIHQLKQQGFKIAAIAKKLNISRNTVYKYLNMDFDEASEWAISTKSRTKKLDSHQDLILSWLKEHPDLSSAQVEDWLKERYPTIKVGGSTVRGYVSELRNIYHIPKVVRVRDHEAVEELPMGHQVQVDWGEITVKNQDKKPVKLYFITFVLSHSRYKYVEWMDRPFTTKDTIRCHEKAFQFFGGIPKEIVYDQDHLITVSENAGDIILTGEFQAYKQERGFRIYLCRKSDPQSKGKVENVVKYVKMNFAKNRVFPNLEAWNEKCLAWLKRTGNYNIHHTTKKRPVEVHALEKQHLTKVSSMLSFESNHKNSITRTVHKDNVIKYKSNRYSLPLGTYRPRGANTVYLEIQDEMLIIKSDFQGEILAKHQICHGKGILIKNRQHTRDRSKGIQAYKETIIRQFKDQEKAIKFVNEVSAQYPRYVRDQLQIIQYAITHFRPQIEEALAVCLKEQLWSANDLRDIAQHLTRLKEGKDVSPTSFEAKQDNLATKATAAKREIEYYTNIIRGVS
ncbi:IS21 family transposase [Fredinandcohnia sp. QZ13]|uniref:IS21 family transposase n=1 Tax=Fredinandcohnia sp. QZ13 TaxID=3073144 RepID=UPI0028531F9B|nr:IS21 family transposase [Fredinandcohnia sp. QZ13]MDR4887983.1 IS21 family transposase [Fredinandcohnia sp. QZ13]MDR4888364.1 IS21 family transposase [Fredinandcohnia sp. QZ13]